MYLTFCNGGIDVFTGENLQSRLRNSKQYSHQYSYRDSTAALQKYLDTNTSKMQIVSGLRGTGKSVMLDQVMLDLDPKRFKQAAFIQLFTNYNVRFFDVESAINTLYENGYRDFFVDEITFASNFPSEVPYLVETFNKKGCHFIFTGTNTLAFHLINKDKQNLFINVPTTWIPYGEWARLLYENDPSKSSVTMYLRYGGILDQYGVPLETARLSSGTAALIAAFGIREYIHTAIALNILNSLALDGQGRNLGILRPLYEEGILLDVIARIVQQENHSFALDNLNRVFEGGDLIQIIRSQEKFSKEKNILIRNELSIAQQISKRLDLIDNSRRKVTKEEAQAIKQYLIDIEFLYPLREYNIFNNEEYQTGSKNIILQPGIRTGQIDLALDMVIQCLLNNLINIDDSFKEKATTSIYGHVLEEMIQAEIQNSLKNCHVAKIKWQDNSAEFDIMVVSPDRRVSLIDVTNSSRTRSDKSQYLRNQEKIGYIKEKFGNIVTSYVVHGEDNKVSNKHWISASDFLRKLYTDPYKLLFCNPETSLSENLSTIPNTQKTDIQNILPEEKNEYSSNSRYSEGSKKILKYELLSHDEPILSFSVISHSNAHYAYDITIHEIGETRLLPFCLRHVLQSKLSAGLHVWLDSRITKLGHKLAARIKSLRNTASRDPDPLSLLTATHGISLNDTFWIREHNDPTTWKKINPYANALSPDLQGLLLSGKTVDTIGGNCISPDFTLDGMMRKSWIRDSRGIFLLKSDMRQGLLSQSMNEWFASQAAAAFGILNVAYDLKCFGTKKHLASECKLFTSEDTGFVKAFHVLLYKDFDRAVLTLNTLGDIRLHNFIAEAFGKETYEDMMVFDYLIGNTDRHLGNFGWLVNNYTGNFICAAPLFDHGKAFFAYEPEIPDNVEEWLANEAQITTFLQPHEHLSFLQPRHEQHILRLKQWEPQQHPDFPIFDQELDAIYRFTQFQCSQALEAMTHKTKITHTPALDSKG